MKVLGKESTSDQWEWKFLLPHWFLIKEKSPLVKTCQVPAQFIQIHAMWKIQFLAGFLTKTRISLSKDAWVGIEAENRSKTPTLEIFRGFLETCTGMIHAPIFHPICILMYFVVILKNYIQSERITFLRHRKLLFLVPNSFAEWKVGFNYFISHAEMDVVSAQEH